MKRILAAAFLAAFSFALAASPSVPVNPYCVSGGYWLGPAFNGTGFNLGFINCFHEGEILAVDFSPTQCFFGKSLPSPTLHLDFFISGDQLEHLSGIGDPYLPPFITYTASSIRMVDPKGFGFPAGSKDLDCSGSLLGDDCFVAIEFQEFGVPDGFSLLDDPLTGVLIVNLPGLEGDFVFWQMTRIDDGRCG